MQMFSASESSKKERPKNSFLFGTMQSNPWFCWVFDIFVNSAVPTSPSVGMQTVTGGYYLCRSCWMRSSKHFQRLRNRKRRLQWPQSLPNPMLLTPPNFMPGIRQVSIFLWRCLVLTHWLLWQQQQQLLRVKFWNQRQAVKEQALELHIWFSSFVRSLSLSLRAPMCKNIFGRKISGQRKW